VRVTATDGDSLVVDGARVRLHGIDAFEADQSCPGADGRLFACGGHATRALQALVAGRDVVCRHQATDRYGRSVAICTAGGRDLGAAMVQAGLALAFVRYADDYSEDEQAARAAGAGVWASGQAITPPWEWRAQGRAAIAEAARVQPISLQPIDDEGCAIRGNINRQGERIYHVPGSRWWARTSPEAVFCSIEEAEAAGFRAPRV
jgi:endonuclease YncB( thermonuclease family)